MNQERLVELTVKKLHGTLSEEEATELAAFEQEASAEQLTSAHHFAEDQSRLVRVLQHMREAEPGFRANRQRLVYPAYEGSGLRRIWLVPGVRRTISVAAVVFVAVAGVFIWKKTETRKEGGIVAVADPLATVHPGSNKAVLVLADGRRVLLDSVATGKIATDGGAEITKDKDGQISYKPLNNKAAAGFNTVTTPQGGQYYVELPDRTKVWLNAASSIRYPTAFDNAVRKVAITGAAYLEVAKDREHPFVVEMGGTNIRVLGTHFNARNYVEDGAGITTLLEGSVEITNGRGKAILKPGQAAVTKQDDVRVEPKVDTNLAIEWTKGRLNFSGADIVSIMNTIKRWYDVQVVFEGTKSNYKIEGSIPKETDIKDVLKMLELAGYRFSIKGKTIYVLP